MNEEQKTLFYNTVDAWYKMMHENKQETLVKEECTAYIEKAGNVKKKWVVSEVLTEAIERVTPSHKTVLVIQEFQHEVSKEYFFMVKETNQQYGSLFTLTHTDAPVFEYEGGQLFSFCLNEAPSHFSKPIHELTEAAKEAIGELPAYRLYQETGLLQFIEME